MVIFIHILPFLWLQKRDYKTPSLNFLCYAIKNIGKRKIHTVLSQPVIFLQGMETICSSYLGFLFERWAGVPNYLLWQRLERGFLTPLVPKQSARSLHCVPLGLASTFDYLRYGLSVILSSLIWWKLRECQILIMGEHQNCQI